MRVLEWLVRISLRIMFVLIIESIAISTDQRFFFDVREVQMVFLLWGGVRELPISLIS